MLPSLSLGMKGFLTNVDLMGAEYVSETVILCSFAFSQGKLPSPQRGVSVCLQHAAWAGTAGFPVRGLDGSAGRSVHPALSRVRSYRPLQTLLQRKPGCERDD